MEVSKAKKNRAGSLKTPVWDQACKLVLIRSDPIGIYNEELDRGVNYFVLMLEQLGATTDYSCEGHPNGFYIALNAPIELALQIRYCGFFRVELEGANHWSLRTREFSSDNDRKTFLRLAAMQWQDKLGPLKALAE